MTNQTYFAVEFGPIRPTRSFARAIVAADREADRRQSPVWLYENGREALRVFPANR